LPRFPVVATTLLCEKQAPVRKAEQSPENRLIAKLALGLRPAVTPQQAISALDEPSANPRLLEDSDCQSLSLGRRHGGESGVSQRFSCVQSCHESVS